MPSYASKIVISSVLATAAIAAPQSSTGTSVVNSSPLAATSLPPGEPARVVTDFKQCLIQHEDNNRVVSPADAQRCVDQELNNNSQPQPTGQISKRDDSPARFNPNPAPVPEDPPEAGVSIMGLKLDALCSSVAPVLPIFMDQGTLSAADDYLARQLCDASGDAFKSTAPGIATTKSFNIANGLKKIAATYHKNEKMNMILSFVNLAPVAPEDIYKLCVISIKSQINSCVAIQDKMHPVKPQTTKWTDSVGVLNAVFDIGFGNGGRNETGPH